MYGNPDCLTHADTEKVQYNQLAYEFYDIPIIMLACIDIDQQ